MSLYSENKYHSKVPDDYVPYKRLAMSVIAESFEFLEKSTKRSKKRKIFTPEADREYTWLAEDGESINFWCEAAELDREAIRERAISLYGKYGRSNEHVRARLSKNKAGR